LESVAEILEECFAKARAAGAVIGTSTSDEAVFLGISAGHLSRIRNERVPLTDEVIAKITSAFAEGNKKYSEALREKLTRIKMLAHARVKTGVREKRLSSSSATSTPTKYSIENLDSLFERISSPGSLLAVDYRDLPQARKGGRYPKFGLKAAEAVKKGLSLALFQPFGSPETIFEKETLIEETLKKTNALDKPEGKAFLDACHYLLDLAVGVREFYRYVTDEANRGGGGEGSIVLYEAVRIHNGKEEISPSLAACGIQSRLFYAEYSDSIRSYKEVYEWVVAHPDEDCFIQRDNLSINLAAVRTQFSPILTYWENNKGKLPVGEQVDKAYEEFSYPFLGKEAKGETRWRDWPAKR
jgi:hypothetical protein